MPFNFVDTVVELKPAGIVTLRRVDPAEEYLKDHFPTFPVLPGVLMIEAMVESARRFLAATDTARATHVLGEVRALKYGSFVRPGDSMRIEVSLLGERDGDAFEFRGAATVIRREAPDNEPRPTCVSGRFVLRPIRLSDSPDNPEQPPTTTRGENRDNDP